MAHPSDEELISRWLDQPAPLLPLLHAFHSRDGYLTATALRTISGALRIPLADLYGTVTFYHHFAQEPPGRNAPRVCTGPVCRLHGSETLLTQLRNQGATAMPCAGRCDEPIPVLIADIVELRSADGAIGHGATPLPVPNPDGYTECVFADIRRPERATFDGYVASGGYQGLQRVLAMKPKQVIDHIRDSKLAGRGGAGFPTATKWEAVAQAPGSPKTIVCNADEGEPGCFKDRTILDYDPHAVIEGMLIAAYATSATVGFIYLRYEYPHTMHILEEALSAAYTHGYLGKSILDQDLDFDIYLRRGAGAYICGEETSLLNSLEGKHPFPRNRPPYPVTHGYHNRPTAVNNVETLASVPHIMRNPPAWYQSLGLDDRAGTKIISLSGDIQRPGNYEVPFGLPLSRLLYSWAGGPLPGHTIQAVTMAGLSGGFLAGDDLDVTLDEPSIRSKGSFLGAGGIMVFDDSRDMVDVAHNAMQFFAHESCGKCFPCRIGTQRLTERLAGEAGPADPDAWIAEVKDINRTMAATSACGLGVAAPMITESLLRYFPNAVEQHISTRIGVDR